MNKVLIALFILYSSATFSQTPEMSKEEFVNQVLDEVIDSGFSKYYLLDEAPPCSFKRYDYDEWVKYGLKKMITIDILNELAKNAYRDTANSHWVEEKLDGAVCVHKDQAENILNPLSQIKNDPSLSEKEKKKAIRKLDKEWKKRPAEEKVVFCFSKPEFTDDFQYAVMNISYRCDDKACGMGTTYLFMQTDNGWKVAGKMVSWSN